MFRISLLTMLCVSLIASFAIAQAPAAEAKPEAKPDTPKNKDNADVKKLAEESNAFALDLYAQFAKEKGNLFASPASIHTALAMTYAGAAGDTAKQMAKTLHLDMDKEALGKAFADMLDKLNKPGEVTIYEDAMGEKSRKEKAYQLVVANAIWGQKGYPFKAEYITLLQTTYRSAVKEVDFADAETAAGKINGWVAETTKDKIKDLVPKTALTPETRMVLTNAIYFKANWENKFEKSATKEEDFKRTLDPKGEDKAYSRTVKAQMMHRSGHYNYFENDDLQLLEMPYKGNELAMVILLPKKDDGLAAVEKSLTAENMGKWVAGAKNEKVNVSLPRFKIEADYLLAKTLTDMGMPEAFTSKADFSGMTDKEALYIGQVIHKSFVAVDEEGTEAGAATAVIMMGASIQRDEPKEFKADHPFVFMIRHNATGNILFMGRLAEPK